MSKRASPMGADSGPEALSPAGPGASSPSGLPPLKKSRDSGGNGRSSGRPSGAAGAGGGAAGHQEYDPEQLGDVLKVAGVNLGEEENLLSGELLNEPGGLAGARLLHAPKDRDYENMLLNYENLRNTMARIVADAGLKLGSDDGASIDGLNQDPLSLISTSCEEWLSMLLAEAAAYSRHRRLSLNPTSAAEQGEASRALRQLVQKDKESEKRHTSLKLQIGLTEQQESGPEKGSEESMQRAANDTARMMTAAVGRKKQFSWMSDSGGSSGSSRLAGSRRQNNDPARFKEIREENGIVMRDLLPALERKHMGVKKALIRGYAKLRN